MTIDYSRVPVWMDCVLDTAQSQRSPQLSFRVRSEDTLGSLEEVFEEPVETSTSRTETSYPRQRLVVTSASGEDGTHSRSASSSCGSPGRLTTLAVSSPDVTANAVGLSGTYSNNPACHLCCAMFLFVTFDIVDILSALVYFVS